MAIVGGNAGRAAFQYWNGSAWTDAQTPGSNNALLVLEVEDILYNPLKVKATLINRPLNPRSGTAASTKGNLTGTISEFIKVRVIDSYSKQIIFSGFAEDVQEKYDQAVGNILIVTCYDNLYELKEFKASPLTKIDTTQTVYNTRSKVIAKMIDYASKEGNLATTDTDQFEASTIAFPSGTGNFTPKDIGKNILSVIHSLSKTEPHTASPGSSTSQTAFGHDFYLSPQYTSTASGATQTPMLNYFKRATRPNTEANMDTYGMKIVFPLSPSDTEGGQTRRMLSDFDFDRVRKETYSEAVVKFVEKGGNDGTGVGTDRKFSTLRVTRLNPTHLGGSSGSGAGTFSWSEKPIAGDLTIDGNYMYTAGKEGILHPFVANQDKRGGSWLVRMWANTVGSSAVGVYTHNGGDDTAKSVNSKYGFENSWFKYAGVPENNDDNDVPGGKVRLSSIATTNLATKGEVIINTVTKHHLKAGDRFILSNISLGSNGAVTGLSQRFKGLAPSGRLFGREAMVATLAGACGNNPSTDTEMLVHKDTGLNATADTFGKHFKIDDNSEDMTVSAIAVADTTQITGNANTGQELVGMSYDKLTITRQDDSTSAILYEAHSTNAQLSHGLMSIGRENGHKDQEGSGGGIFDHNIFRVERVIADTQFIVKSDLGAVSWTTGTVNCGLLHTTINDSASTTTVVLKKDGTGVDAGTIRAAHASVGCIIKIGSEEMLVKEASFVNQDLDSSGSAESGGATLVVERGYNGTTRAGHDAGDAVLTMMSHVIPVVGRVQYQSKLDSWTSGTDYILVSDLNSNFPTTGHFRLGEINYADDSYGAYVECNSSSQTISYAETIGFNKPSNFQIAPGEKNPDSIRVAMSEALSNTSSETRSGTVRINNYAYQYIDGTAYSVSSTTVTCRNTANDTALNPFAYGLRVGMVAWKLTSASDSTMAAYGYVSAVNATTFTVTLNTGSFSADDKFRIFVPLRPGNLVQVKNKLIGIDTTSSNTFSDAQTQFMVTSVEYAEGQGQQASTIGLVKADDGVISKHSAFKRVEKEADSQSFTSIEDEIVEDTSSIELNVNFKPGLRGSVDTTSEKASNVKLKHQNRGLHWDAGTLKYKGEEYIIPAGNSSDGVNLDDVYREDPFQFADVGSVTPTTDQLFNTANALDDEGNVAGVGGGAVNNIPDSYHICFVDFGAAKGTIKLQWVDKNDYFTRVVNKASKLVLGEGHANLDLNGLATFHPVAGVTVTGNTRLKKKNGSAFVGQGYGAGTQTTPVISFDSDLDTGFYHYADGYVGVTSAGSVDMALGNNYVYAVGGYAWLNDLNTYINLSAADTFQFVGGGTSLMTMTKDGASKTLITIPTTLATDSGTDLVINSSNQIQAKSSSIVFKENIESIEIDSNKIDKLRPVIYNYKNSTETNKNIGLIAEEVEEIMPDLVVKDKDGKPYSVKYSDLTVVLLSEIQKLKQEIKDIKESK